LIKENEKDVNRIGFTVSKKVSKKAVVRNKIKRRLRCLAKDLLKDDIKKGYDFVFIARATSVDSLYSDAENQLKFAIKKLNLLK
jgi:ribonuclease P protein component